MNDSRSAMAAAVAGGYLLGRTKKARLAFAVGSYLVGRRMGVSPGQVLSQRLGGLQQVPQLRELTEQMRGELLTAGRAAVTAAANRRLTSLADGLRDRTDALDGGGGRDDGYGEPPDGDAYFDEEDRDEDRSPAPPPTRTTPQTARKAPPREATPPVRKAAKKTVKKAVPAKKTAKRAASPGRPGGLR
ncbi:hypothetical protein KVH30_14395 [Streptomyces olivaceus]|uniref:hypothetical protein n=1 Tax=Streptomyces olivaceus TaxID=47716 RepID=UPI001CCAE9F5|nr:hypothetical protein [Streptomyces olivaceus]MBZ6292310.1 hypothetical protein [Streptomyces olivaceus]MBZ6326714.1 hypothetical protein [Streptomyces olivaceus]